MTTTITPKRLIGSTETRSAITAATPLLTLAAVARVEASAGETTGLLRRTLTPAQAEAVAQAAENAVSALSIPSALADRITASATAEAQTILDTRSAERARAEALAAAAQVDLSAALEAGKFDLTDDSDTSDFA